MSLLIRELQPVAFWRNVCRIQISSKTIMFGALPSFCARPRQRTRPFVVAEVGWLRAVLLVGRQLNLVSRLLILDQI
jgi:hypothetical protein